MVPGRKIASRPLGFAGRNNFVAAWMVTRSERETGQCNWWSLRKLRGPCLNSWKAWLNQGNILNNFIDPWKIGEMKSSSLRGPCLQNHDSAWKTHGSPLIQDRVHLIREKLVKWSHHGSMTMNSWKAWFTINQKGPSLWSTTWKTRIVPEKWWLANDGW